MTKSEGVIKFQLNFTRRDPLPPRELSWLNQWRQIMYDRRLIGRDLERYGGHGFGNLSARIELEEGPCDGLVETQRPFIISGTQTGHLRTLGPEHYAIVIACQPEHNRVIATGPLRPSSESLTHGAIYATATEIRAVIHAHSPVLWHCAQDLALPTTDSRIAYGSPAMADEVHGLVSAERTIDRGIFAMGGHEDGIIAFGATLDDAGQRILEALATAHQLSIP